MGVCVCVITKRSGSGSASSRCHEGKRGWSGWGNGVSTYSVLIAAPPVGGMRYLRVSERERERGHKSGSCRSASQRCGVMYREHPCQPGRLRGQCAGGSSLTACGHRCLPHEEPRLPKSGRSKRNHYDHVLQVQHLMSGKRGGPAACPCQRSTHPPIHPSTHPPIHPPPSTDRHRSLSHPAVTD